MASTITSPSLPRSSSPSLRTKLGRLLAVGAGLALLSAAPASAATILPIGPISFDAAAYDSQFREADLKAIIWSNATSSLLVSGNTVGTAIYDQSATGGSGGQGGTGGSGINNDLSDFVISGTFRTGARTPSNKAGFFLRLDDNDANGYLATLEITTSGGAFRLFEGVGISSTDVPVPGSEIFSQSFTLSPAPNTSNFYHFEVIAEGDTFHFSFDHGAATASFTDESLSRTVGQVGLYLSSGPSATSRFNEFSVTAIPEPSSVAFVVIGGIVSLLGINRMKRRRQ